MELAALPFTQPGSDVKTLKCTSSSFGLFTSEGKSVLTMLVSTSCVAAAGLWALDCSFESPKSVLQWT